MPPRALMSSTYVLMDVASSSLEPVKENACWTVLRLAQGNTTLTAVGLTPRSLAVNVPHRLCTGPPPDPLVAPPEVPPPVPPPAEWRPGRAAPGPAYPRSPPGPSPSRRCGRRARTRVGRRAPR